MGERGKPDGPVVPANLPGRAAAAEAGEEKGTGQGYGAQFAAPEVQSFLSQY
jgi:hypothetical protein